MSSIFKKFTGGGVNARPGITNFNVLSPGFRLSSALNSDNSLGTSLTRTGSAAQEAADIRIPRILTDIDSIRDDIRPGFGRLTDARVLANDRARERGIGNLRDRLAQRRIAGSSFANSSLIQAEREFGEQEERGRAQSFLEELELNTRVLNQEFGVIETELQREIQELGIAAGFSSNISNLLEQQRRADTALAVSNANNTASFLSATLGAITGSQAFGGGPSGGGGGGGGGGSAPTSVNTLGSSFFALGGT